ncbi:WD40/YVTN/BNR-like repeat-containing protein [Streptacidiphilus rugosus]|uniref:WD40/YVTN/BNR-like repeat-containing protein n=1 Tax=Streptacidiphilus rugosus TaxID=405783 RepID=UPI00055D15AB|nr:sialidase family protein [Streptacidiphilus rugosus]
MTETLLAVGTAKGLFLGRSKDRRSWSWTGPHFLMQGVYSVAVDRRGTAPRLLVGADSSHWGPSVFTSDDLGATWQEPAAPAVKFPEGTDASLTRVWQLKPAGPDEPGVVYAGTEPAALFRSEDGGVSFTLNESLWRHPQREQWQAGFGGQGLHTIVLDPRDPRAITIAVSTGGVYRSLDGGASWEPSNTGIEARFLPEPDNYPEFGQCVHKVSQDAVDPSRLYLQNHGGVYRSDDAGAVWKRIDSGLPADFGFPVAAHPHRADTAYVFPLTADYERIAPEHRCRVYRTEDAGETWQPLEKGLPAGEHFGVVLRDALATDDGDPAGIYFGNKNGEVYGSADEGESWTLLSEHLPSVLCVRAVTLD